MGLDFMTDTAVISGMGTVFTVQYGSSGDGAYGNTVDADDRRTQLSPHNVDGLLFIHRLK